MKVYVHKSSFICKSQKLETTQLSTNRWVDTQNVVKPFNALLLATKNNTGTSLVVQWVRLHAPNAGGQVQSLVGGLDPACKPQLRSPHATTTSPHATTKTRGSKNKYTFFKNNNNIIHSLTWINLKIIMLRSHIKSIHCRIHLLKF